MTLNKACPKLCKVIKMLRIPLLELILKHGSSRIRPGTKYCSLSLVQRRLSPRNTWWMPHLYSFLPKISSNLVPRGPWERGWISRTTRRGIILPLKHKPRLFMYCSTSLYGIYILEYINGYIVYKRSGCLALKNIAYYKIYTLLKTALGKNISCTCGWSDWKFLPYIFRI